MRNTHRVVLCAVLSTLAASCSRSESKTDVARKDSAAGGDMKGMAGMPGMGAGSKTSDDSAKTEPAEAVKPGANGALAMSVKFTPAQIQHGGVRWGPVAIGTASGAATVPGEVIPNEDRTARLGAPARGRVLLVSVRPGDRVTAGQVLVTLQSPEAGMAQSDLAKADAELGSRQAEVQYTASARARAERLLTLKAIPRQDYDRAVTDEEHARAALTQAEAEARRARTTAGQLGAGGANGEIIIRAPAAGVVLSRTAVPGAVVEAGAPLVLVTDPANLWLTVNAPEQMAGLFHRGGHLRFTVPAYPTDTFAARIDAVGAALETDTRTLGVRAAIATVGPLKPQMLATVVVEGAGVTQTAFVPEDAVQLIQGRPHVFLAQPDGKGGARFERREVALGSRTGGRVAVLRGLSGSDIVVVAGSFAVKAEFQKAAMPKMEM